MMITHQARRRMPRMQAANRASTSHHNGGSWLDGVIIGSIAGFVGTLAIHALTKANQKIVGGETSPIRQDPGKFMLRKAEQLLPSSVRQRIPEKVEEVASQALGFDYGMMFGALYGMMRPRGGSVLRDGASLGLANWATGFLGWLPATKLTPPIWRQDAKQIIIPIFEHVVYGITTVAAFNMMHQQWCSQSRANRSRSQRNVYEPSDQIAGISGEEASIWPAI